MPSDKDEFFRACINNGLIVDANLFLLLAFGTSHKRTDGMDEEMVITKSIATYCSDKGGKLILTPHVIAEVSNMLINRQKGFDFAGNTNFIILTNFLREAFEHPVPKSLILDNKHLAYVGFTDLSILEAAKENNYGVLTVDGGLYTKLCDEGCYVVDPKAIAKAKSLRLLMS